MIMRTRFIVFFLIIIIHLFAFNHHEQDVKNYVIDLFNQQNYQEILSIYQNTHLYHNPLGKTEGFPSIYRTFGETFYRLSYLSEAEKTFQEAIRRFPNDTRSLLLLGEIYSDRYEMDKANEYFKLASQNGHYGAIPRILRNKINTCSWENFEMLSYDLEKFSQECLESTEDYCGIDATYGIEFTDANPTIFKKLMILEAKNSSTNMKNNSQSMPAETIVKSSPLTRPTPTTLLSRKRLKIGFLSSDFGLHTVVTLIRGLFQFMNQNHFEIYCFSLSNEHDSWWKQNISQTISLDHFILLNQPSRKQSDSELAMIISSYSIDIIIDLNGHTVGTGLSILSYRPAAIQVSFLGIPKTTGANYMDYYLGDRYANPPEHQDYFSEALMLMNQCVIVNDYWQSQSSLIHQHLFNRASPLDLPLPKELFDEIERINLHHHHSNAGDDEHENILLMGTFSNSQKLDPVTFHVWMNLLHYFPSAKFLLMRYPSYSIYIKNIMEVSQMYGIHSSHRIASIPQLDWFTHLFNKTSVDLLLDTTGKNGHTTGLDGLWSGIPTITNQFAKHTESRAGESMAKTMQLDYGLSVSMKDYEDILVLLMKNKRKMKKDRVRFRKVLWKQQQEEEGVSNDLLPEESIKRISFYDSSPSLLLWRKKLLNRRISSPLFNTTTWTRQFERLLHAIYDIHHTIIPTYFDDVPQEEGEESQDEVNGKVKNRRRFHVFSIATETLS